jgi:hypothetical protein
MNASDGVELPHLEKKQKNLEMLDFSSIIVGNSTRLRGSTTNHWLKST